ncbi:FecR family protein [Kordiimonas pumila]|uniref:FecR family protein n=1 Tax=Kordiimonas pumila TaxID=2161677 RepID=A0ABV7D0C4_9PROT|nr:FecR domain-containing protein [Kordiimonas pumila]
MSKISTKQRAIIEEASDWVVRLDGAPLGVPEQKELADWLQASPENVREFLFAATTFHALADIETSERLPIDLLLAEKAPSVVPLFRKSAEEQIFDHKDAVPVRSFSKVWKPLALIAATLLFVAVSATTFWQTAPDIAEQEVAYSTVVGEQRSVSLIDGSVIYLNTNSKVAVLYKDNERAIQLIEGEALFKVTHDPTRPFRVYAGGAIAEAVGTTFNVYRRHDQTDVAVVEGRVAVSPIGETASAQTIDSESMQDFDKIGSAKKHQAKLYLTKGQEAAVGLSGTIAPVRMRATDDIMSWRNRRLVFEAAPLEAIAREFNRYNKVKIVIADPLISKVEFDGVFDADDPEAFIRFLKLTGSIEAVRTSEHEIQLRKMLKPKVAEQKV